MGLLFGFVLPYTLVLNKRVQDRFNELVFAVPTKVYARPLPLAAGTPMTPAALELELTFAGYSNDGKGQVAGSWVKQGARYTIASRGYAGPDGGELPKRIRVTLGRGMVQSVQDAASGKPIELAHLDPARIATLYGASQEERRFVRLADVPPLLVSGLQAVEDRDFNHHIGIDVSAIARAAFANLRAGHTVQGGSTLTQQLVRNLFLSRDQNLTRKINEALMSLLLEAHYSKGRILEAYVNDVFLGQQGGQAVHGLAAAAEFYFGREPRDLSQAEIALLVGMIQGPSLYDPRRHAELARNRRNLVLNMFYETGLIDEATLTSARAAALGVPETPGLPRNATPAFLDLVRAQLARDYPAAELQRAGLSVYTTLAPSTQMLAEQAMTKTLETLGKRQPELQAAMVVTGAHDGEVQALIGARDPADPGFDRALDAQRPIGSLIKPFVYLVALAQPKKYSLATLLDDAPVDMVQPNGTHWTPQNDDHEAHGKVALVDALAHSYNLATVHLGLELGVDKVRGLLDSFNLGVEINRNPSLLLGAVDLSPFEVAQLYQYFSADGHAVPLRALRGVIDAQGRPLTRYAVKPGAGDYIQAARLISYAMQQVTQVGTARAVAEQGLGFLHAAGKTGTSDSQRDSWFAGFTGSHLAVVWVGRDDNKQTGLYGATGALQVWMGLLHQLPSSALELSQDGLDTAWVNPQSGARTDQQCPGARALPFMAGFVPEESDSCKWFELKSIFGAGH